MNHERTPEWRKISDPLRTLVDDADRYRALKERFVGADFTQPNPNGQGTRCVLIFDWPERAPVSKSLDDTVDALDQ